MDAIGQLRVFHYKQGNKTVRLLAERRSHADVAIKERGAGFAFDGSEPFYNGIPYDEEVTLAEAQEALATA